MNMTLEDSADLDEDKQNIEVADESVDRGQKRLRRGNLTKKQRGKIERTIEYHQELMWCTERQCEKKDRATQGHGRLPD
jgi:lipopolysaccharide biosynthesis regulator YciM